MNPYQRTPPTKATFYKSRRPDGICGVQFTGYCSDTFWITTTSYQKIKEIVEEGSGVRYTACNTFEILHNDAAVPSTVRLVVSAQNVGFQVNRAYGPNPYWRALILWMPCEMEVEP